MTTRNSILKHVFNNNDEHLISFRRYNFSDDYNLPYRKSFTRPGYARLAISFIFFEDTLKKTPKFQLYSTFLFNHFILNLSKYSQTIKVYKLSVKLYDKEDFFKWDLFSIINTEDFCHQKEEIRT